ncbi:hypothetical protein [Clostridium sp. D33t1_170424_F3]|uniref:hypothetical protein n=1 Tax=Clostridium sp. D33t1_170424_F3 TaxID=2787099 RepID=UPI0018A8DCE3|nr:hypothetical protein [Clostridium sp. D33t1_170424_F3]
MEKALIIIGVCAALIIGAGYLVVYAKNKGFNLGGAVKAADAITGAVNSAFDTIKPFLPAHPAVSIIEAILGLAETGVNSAERLYKTATIDAEQRQAEATDFVLNALTAAGVEVTPEIKKVIDGAIVGAVELLPKTHDENGNIIK